VKLSTNVRNILIVVVLGLIVGGVTAGRTTANVVTQAVSLGFLGAFAWIGTRLYREHRSTLESLGIRHRTVLYCAIGALILVLSATSRAWSTSFGSIIWLVVVAGSIYALVAVYRSSKDY
jgi:hypothetical protein